MRMLTLRQPYAGAVFHGKDVENRPGAFTYRGLLGIHAGQLLAAPDAFSEVEAMAGVTIPGLGSPAVSTEWAMGAVIGVVTLVDAHRWADCRGSCSPWAQPGKAHHRLEDPRVLARPVSAYGKQGLWAPDAALLAEIRGRL